MPTLDGKTVAIGELFSQRFFFKIPEYQRPFLWSNDNIQDLIDDLTDAARDRQYFLGTLVLHDLGDSLFDVVDGQQRLTALCILLACLRDSPSLHADESFRREVHEKILQPARELDGIPERNRVQVREQALFNRLIAAEGGTRVALEEPKDADTRYHAAIRLFSERVDGMTGPELKEFAGFVTRKCVVIYLATDTFDDAFRLFTIVNDRGMQLRRIDVLKAVNLHPDVVPSEDARKRYAQQWEELEERLGESNFEDVFRLMRLIYVQDKPQADLLKEFQTRILGKPGKPRRGKELLDALAQYVDLYDALFVAKDYLEGSAENARFKTMIHCMTSEFSASEWKACLLHFAKRFGKDGIYDYTLAIEKVYLEHWVQGVRKDERYSTYTGLLARIDRSDSGPAAAAGITYDAEAIQKACRAKNFYGSGFAKYFLLRAEVLAAELDHPRAFVARSIEHVLPQNPADPSAWRAEFSQDDIDALVHTVGNLVLLSKSKNSIASRKEFDEKKRTYLVPRVSDFPRSVKVLEEIAWTKATIERRTEEFAMGILDNP